MCLCVPVAITNQMILTLDITDRLLSPEDVTSSKTQLVSAVYDPQSDLLPT